MKWILIIVEIIAALIFVMYLPFIIFILYILYNLLIGNSIDLNSGIIPAGAPPEYHTIKELKSLFGKNDLFNKYEVLEYESLLVDNQCHLVIKLEDTIYSNILNIISSPDYSNQLIYKNTSITDIWICSDSEFHLNPEFIKNNFHKDLRLSVRGCNKQNTITYNSIYIVGSC
jgi:hypothetical protein